VVQRKRLSAREWTAAAVEALAAGGVAAVAVEPIAARLGTTKGSFYWHFTGRDALLEAALAHWERTGTEDVIALIETEPDLPSRLRKLLTAAIDGHDSVELALQPSAGHPLVAPVLARVTERRLTYLTALFTEIGFPPVEARHRSQLAYTAYLGHAQLRHATPALAPGGTAYVDAVIAALTSR
jgi:AcrR family transcriptional regulator